MAVINGLPLGTQGKSSIKVVQTSFNGSGTSEVLDSYNEDSKINEPISFMMACSSWAQGGSVSMNCALQGSNDRTAWNTVRTEGATYPASAYASGNANNYRYYRLVFTGTMQRGYGMIACAGPLTD